jgi:hypothetical protein
MPFKKIKYQFNFLCKKSYKSFIRKKANMQGGQASKLKQRILYCPLLLELVDKKHPVYIMGKGKDKGKGKGKSKGESKGKGKGKGKSKGEGKQG